MSKATLISLVLIAALLAPQLARADQVSDTIAELTSQITQLRLQLITLLQQRLSSLVDQVMLLQQQQQDTNNNSNNNNYQSANPTSPTCSPASQSVLVNQTASLTASGGSGTGYVWSAPGGSPATGSGASFSTAYAAVGTKTVTLTDSAVLSSTCSVNVGSQQQGTVTISVIDPTVGKPGTVVKVYGSGFTPTGNTVNFNEGTVVPTTLTSTYGISFTVPPALPAGNYTFFAQNINGTSNAVNFTVIKTFAAPPLPPAQQGSVSLYSFVDGGFYYPSGGVVHIAGSGFTPTGNSVKFTSGGEALNVVSVAQPDGSSRLLFTIPPTLPEGDYIFYVTNTNGVSNWLGQYLKIRNPVWQSGFGNSLWGTPRTCTVCVDSVSKNPVYPGDTITITGSGFTATNNKVGIGNIPGQYSSLDLIITSQDTTHITGIVPMGWRHPNNTGSIYPEGISVQNGNNQLGASNGTTNGNNFMLEIIDAAGPANPPVLPLLNQSW